MAEPVGTSPGVLQTAGGGEGLTVVPGEKERRGSAPLSFHQDRLWFLHQLDPASSAYNLAGALRIQGVLDGRLLERALNEIVARHDVLRATFGELDGEPVQAIVPEIHVPLPCVTVHGTSFEEQQAAALDLATREADRPFNLAEGPVLRATLFRLRQDHHILLIAVHHIVADGWSIGILLRELATLYDAFSHGEPSPIAEPAAQYADFALWQRHRFNDDSVRQQLAYWKRELRHESDVLSLPTDRPRPQAQTFAGSRHYVRIPLPLKSQLQEMSRREGTTLFMTLLAAFQILLTRYSGRLDVSVGLPISTRTRGEFDGVVGFFLNTLVFRGCLTGDPSFRGVLSRTRRTAAAAYENQDVPFEKLVEILKPARDRSYPPFFQVMFSLQCSPTDDIEVRGLRLSRVDLQKSSAMFDLTLCALDDADGLHACFEYNSDLFLGATIARMGDNFRSLLEEVTTDPSRPLSALRVVTDAEYEMLTRHWARSPAVQTPETMLLHELFEAQAVRTPDAVAVVDRHRTLTYRELDEHADHLAQRLQDAGVNAETTVAICVERSWEMVVGLLGILKSNGAYVGLEPGSTEERVDLMHADLGVNLVVTSDSLVQTLPPRFAHLVVEADPTAGPCHSRKRTAGCHPLSPRSLAYVIYTSGSTGVPKAIGIEHRQAVAFLEWAKDAFGPDDLRGVLATTSPLFDCTLVEAFVPLSWGGTVVLAQSVLELPSVAERFPVTFVSAVPSVIAQVIEADDLPPSIRRLHVHGEAMDPELVQRLHRAREGIALWNCYGPSETTTYATVKQLFEGDFPTIGRPISGTQVYVLDRDMNPVPIGVPGELYVGGRSVGRGYLNRPGRTATRFVADPFGDKPGGRLYRTGDLVRYTPSGDLIFLGRRDRQLKVRGVRVEPGEVEAVLTRHPGVAEAVVMGRSDGNRVQRLTAYVVPAGEAPLHDLHEFIRERLPRAFLPDQVTVLESLPRTPNGKVDVARLPSTGETPGDPAKWKPNDYVEASLLEVWQSVLKVEDVRAEDDFFDLGGHSLLVLVALSRIRALLGADLSVDEFFSSSTIKGLAERIRSRWVPVEQPALVKIGSGASLLPLFCVHSGPGDVAFLRSLVRHVDLVRPVYGFRSIGLDGCQEPLRTVEEMAERYLRELRQVQSVGPYLLAGNCVGGLVALEMAQQLVHRGEDVGFLGLFDTAAPSRNLCHYAAKMHFGQDLEDLTDGEIVQARMRQMRTELAGFGFRDDLDDRELVVDGTAHVLPSLFRRMAEVFVRNLMAAASYVPRPYPGRIAFFRAEETEVEGLERDWLPLAQGGLDVFPIDADHDDIGQSPELGERLRLCLGDQR